MEITGEVSAERFLECHKKAASKLTKEVKAPGFRPGKIPEGIALDKIGATKPILVFRMQIILMNNNKGRKMR
ncbi:trigger factor [Patescibacteria group bacterium]